MGLRTASRASYTNNAPERERESRRRRRREPRKAAGRAKWVDRERRGRWTGRAEGGEQGEQREVDRESRWRWTGRAVGVWEGGKGEEIPGAVQLGEVQ